MGIFPYSPQFLVAASAQPQRSALDDLLARFPGLLSSTPPGAGRSYDPTVSSSPGGKSAYEQLQESQRGMAGAFIPPSSVEAIKAAAMGARAGGQMDYVNQNVRPVAPYTPFAPDAAPVHAPVALPQLQTSHADPTATLLALAMGLAAPAAGASFMGAAKQGELSGAQMANSRALQNYELQRGQSETGYQDALRNWAAQNAAKQSNVEGVNAANQRQDAQNMQLLGMTAPLAGEVAGSKSLVPALGSQAGKESALAKAQTENDLVKQLIEMGYKTGAENAANHRADVMSWANNQTALPGVLLQAMGVDTTRAHNQGMLNLESERMKFENAIKQAGLKLDSQRVGLEGQRIGIEQQRANDSSAYHDGLLGLRKLAIENKHNDLMSKNKAAMSDPMYRTLHDLAIKLTDAAIKERQSFTSTPESIADAADKAQRAQDELTKYTRDKYPTQGAASSPPSQKIPQLPGFKQGAKKTPSGIPYSITP